MLVDFNREILLEWLGSENSSSIESKDTKMSARNQPNICTDPYARGQESDWPNPNKLYNRKTIINKLCRASNSLS